MDEHFENYVTLVLGYLLYTESYQLYKYIKKWFHKLPFFNSTDIVNKPISDYIIMKGKASKLYTFTADDIFNYRIVELSPYTHYHEDFLMSDRFIQPYDKTKYLLNASYNQRNIFTKFFSWLFPIYHVNHNDEVTIFGKIIHNDNFIMNDYSKYPLVKAKMIAHDMDETGLLDHVQQQEVNKITIQIIKVTILGSMLYLLAKYSIYPKVKRFFKLFRYRAQVHCDSCKIKPCNLLCEKCEYLTNYCDECYIAFQAKINKAELELNNIRCANCQRVLDKVQKLLID
jgi:hypothetical protein